MIHIFIVNPYAGQKTFADNLRNRLSDFKDIKYFVFNTRYAGYERDVISKIINLFEGEQLRFYCCGGSGTMRNMLCGFENFDNVEIAFFPCGLTNDFLKTFGENEKRFYNIEELIYGDVISVDYIKTNHGVALNTFTVGIDSMSQMLMDRYRMLSVFGEQVPYVLSIVVSILAMKYVEYEIEIDGEKIEENVDEMFLGNGHVLGGNLFFDHKSDAKDGKARYVIYPSKNAVKKIIFMMSLMHDQVEKCYGYARYGYVSKFRIKRKDGKPFVMNYDGELEYNNTIYEGEIVQKGLRFVVPKGVKI